MKSSRPAFLDFSSNAMENLASGAGGGARSGAFRCLLHTDARLEYRVASDAGAGDQRAGRRLAVVSAAHPSRAGDFGRPHEPHLEGRIELEVYAAMRQRQSAGVRTRHLDQHTGSDVQVEGEIVRAL